MRAAFFGTYNREHTATRIAAAAVRAAGYEIVEFHDPLWEKTREKDAAYFSPLSLLGLGLAWLASAIRLARAWRRSGGAPVAVVGFNGQLDILLLRLLGRRYGPRIVFAPLVSLTETLVEDRGVYAPGSVAARALALLDRATCSAADVVVVDTEAHRRWFLEELGVDPSRLLVCHLGADPDAFLAAVPAGQPGQSRAAPATLRGQAPPACGVAGDLRVAAAGAATPPAAAPEVLDVLWFGQYLPLHGLDVIVDAVGRLAMRDGVRGRLRFTFLGTGESRARIEASLRATRADVRFVDWVPYEKLAARIAAADIVLGIFGASRKARMVIPNKVYEAAAVGAAIVTADTSAVREVFEDGEEVLLCRADGRALAAAIEKLADANGGAQLRARLGAGARRRMQEAFSAEALGRAWGVALAGPDALARRRDAKAKTGVVVLCFQDARRALECLHSVAADDEIPLDILVVDNASVEEQHRILAEGIEGRIDAELLTLERNLGYAGANNVAMRTLFARGCEHVLLLNSDTIVSRGSIAALVRGARRGAKAGPIGPRISEGRPGQAPLSLGERYRVSFLWAPRSLLRVRSRRQSPYPVSGVGGCAMLVPRSLFESIGGFDESLFAYYEEVDLCLRARAAGFTPMVVPEADIGHEGQRGFAGGMTPLAAWLKARNLGLVASKRLTGRSRFVFDVGHHLLVAASAALYVARGRRDVASAMFAGLRASSGEGGEPPAELFAASGYASSGHAGEADGGASSASLPGDGIADRRDSAGDTAGRPDADRNPASRRGDARAPVA